MQYFGQYFSYCIQAWHDVRLMDALYARARFDDMTLTLMQVHSGLVKATNQRFMLSVTKQSIRIKLAATVGHFLRVFHLDFEDDYVYGLSILFSILSFIFLLPCLF